MLRTSIERAPMTTIGSLLRTYPAHKEEISRAVKSAGLSEIPKDKPLDESQLRALTTELSQDIAKTIGLVKNDQPELALPKHKQTLSGPAPTKGPPPKAEASELDEALVL